MHRKKNTNLHLPIINNNDESHSVRSKNSRLLSAKTLKRHRSDNKLNTNNGEEIFLKIPRINLKHKKNKSCLEGNKTDNYSTEEMKNRNNNFIHIVNNLNRKNDKNNIGLKVNINQYDIMYYIPNKNAKDKEKEKNDDINIQPCELDNKSLDNSENANLNTDDKISSEGETLKDSSKDTNVLAPGDKKKLNLNINNNAGNNTTNDLNKKGINVDIIKISKKTKECTKEEIEMEKRIRRHILHKIKSMNNIYKTDFFNNRPKLHRLESNSDDSIENGNRKYKNKKIIKKFLSKEITDHINPLNINEDIDDEYNSNESFLINNDQKYPSSKFSSNISTGKNKNLNGHASDVNVKGKNHNPNDSLQSKKKSNIFSTSTLGKFGLNNSKITNNNTPRNDSSDFLKNEDLKDGIKKENQQELENDKNANKSGNNLGNNIIQSNLGNKNDQNNNTELNDQHKFFNRDVMETLNKENQISLDLSEKSNDKRHKRVKKNRFKTTNDNLRDSDTYLDISKPC